VLYEIEMTAISLALNRYAYLLKRQTLSPPVNLMQQLRFRNEN